jgi:predicted DNA-binding protein
MDTSKLEELRCLASEIATEYRLKRKWERDIEKIENLQYIEDVLERVKMQVSQCLYTLQKRGV